MILEINLRLNSDKCISRSFNLKWLRRITRKARALRSRVQPEIISTGNRAIDRMLNTGKTLSGRPLSEFELDMIASIANRVGTNRKKFKPMDILRGGWANKWRSKLSADRAKQILVHVMRDLRADGGAVFTPDKQVELV